MFFIIAILLIAADQIFKLIINHALTFRSGIEVIPGFFDLVNWRNTGAAWGVFSNSTAILSVISIVASLSVIYMLPKAKSPFFKLSLSLVLAGAVGNVIDRIRLGYVVDYLSFNIFGYDFPVFNLADICVVIGCIFMMIFILFIHKEDALLFEKPLFPFLKKEISEKKEAEENDNG